MCGDVDISFKLYKLPKVFKILYVDNDNRNYPFKFNIK